MKVTTDEEEIFLKNVLQDFYRKIIEINDFNYFEKTSIEWITHKLKSNDKNPKEFLK